MIAKDDRIGFKISKNLKQKFKKAIESDDKYIQKEYSQCMCDLIEAYVKKMEKIIKRKV